MQHPEEGTIHSWLDGQLPLTEAADIEAHIAGCPTCGAVVAEARGFIAASSRILTALDDAPRGVIPAAAPRSGNRRAMLRAAAAVFVVAAGSFAVLNRTGPDATNFDSTANREATPAVVNQSATSEPVESPALDAAGATAPVSPAPEETPPANRIDGRGVTLSQVPARGSGNVTSAKRAPVTGPARGESSTSAGTDAAPRKSAQLQEIAVPPQAVASRVADNALSAPTSAGLSDVAVASPVPRFVRSDSVSGTRRTIYDVGAGKTVTLTETSADAARFAENVPAIGVAGGVAQSAPRMEKARGAESRTGMAQGTSAAAATPAPPPPKPAAAIAVTTISWVDASTRKRLTLSGPFTIEELRAIRARLDALKPQAQKKTP